MNKENLEEFEELAKPIAEFLKKNYYPYGTAVISIDSAKVVRDELGIPKLDR